MKSITNFRNDLLYGLSALLAVGLLAAAVSASPIGKIEILSVSPRDVAVSTTDIFDKASNGLNVIGVGATIYVEAIPTSTTLAAANGWSVGRRPYGSVAQMNPAIGDVSAFVPDVEGVYHLILTPVDGAGAPYDSVEQVVYVGTYIGAGVFNTHDTPDNSIPHCGNACCHSENANPRLNVVGQWIDSNHATALQRHLAGLNGANFPARCLACHSTGYDVSPLAINNGFDDIAQMIGFDLNLIPIMVANAANTGVDEWPNLPAELQGHASIQCENCHGAGSQHLGNILAPGHGIGGVDLSAKQCSQCHDSGTHHVRPYQWDTSRHAQAAPRGSAGCAPCHSAEGFVNVLVDGKPSAAVQDPHAITCVACHDPHNSEFEHQLRLAGDATLPSGFVVKDPGMGGLCMRCHNSRQTDGEARALSSSSGVHYGPQADMMAGQTAAAFGLPWVGNSAHSTIVKDTCVTCHMAAGGHGDIATVGDHTFSMRDTKGTSDESDDELNVEAACAICHPEMTDTYDRESRGDYDGDGALEGIQEEVKGLMALLTTGIVAELNNRGIAFEISETGKFGGISSGNYASLPEDFRRAIYNLGYVAEDKSFGIHNTAFTVQMLQRSYFGVYGRSIVDDFPGIELRGPVQPSSATPTPTPTPPPVEPTPVGPPPLAVINILGVSPRVVDADQTGVFDEVASGLNAVGIGTKVYMQGEAKDPSVTGFSWVLTQKPQGSAAALVQATADLVTLRPDINGVYKVQLTALDAAGPTTSVYTQTIYGTTWVGAGVFNTHETPNPNVPNCGTAFCHGEDSFRPELRILDKWIQSNHAQTLQLHLGGARGDHLNATCLPCHSLGYNDLPSAVNNGFDDRARDNDHPTTLIAQLVKEVTDTGVDQWPNLPAVLQSHASVQCESCHGAGFLHVSQLGAPDHGIDGANLGTDQCAQCHDSASGFQQGFYQWSSSSHPITAESSEGHVQDNASCRICHTGEGFIEGRVKGYTPQVHQEYHGITCAVCHDPHYTEKPHQLRVAGDFVIPSGQTTYGAGNGGLCVRCHNSRSTNGETTALTSSRGLHYGCEADMLLGANGASFGLPFEESSPHVNVVPGLCAHCHMAEPTEAGYGVIEPPKVGSHTFAMRDDMGTEHDQSDDVINAVNACASCHIGIDTFDFAVGQDYDGDGTVEGIQTEVNGLFDLLRPGIASSVPGATLNDHGYFDLASGQFSSVSDDQKKAVFNFNYVWKDGSFGVHNTNYAIQLLQRSYFGVYGRSILDDYPDIDLAGPVQEPGTGSGQPNLWMAR